MKRPWQIWTLFVLCLALVLPAMAWLTLKALELDRAQSDAQQQLEQAHRNEQLERKKAEFAGSQAMVARNEAEFQEIVASALWRMDWTLTPLVAQEAARPYYVYDSFFITSVGKDGAEHVPSPLLIQPSEYVLLHFQLSQDDKWTSPQNPVGAMCDLAVSNGAPIENITCSRDRLEKIQQQIDHKSLLAMLPEALLPAIEAGQVPWGNNLSVNYDGNKLFPANGSNTSDFGIPKLNEPQQLSELQAEVQTLQLDLLNPEQQKASPLEQRSQSGRGQSPANRANQTQQGEQVSQVDDNQFSNSRRQELLRGYEWQTRNRAFESYAQNQILQQRFNTKTAAPDAPNVVVREGVTRPAWVNSNLILARRVTRGKEVLIQGCWLDWEKVKKMLLDEIADLLPEVDLVPVQSDNESMIRPGRMLATLPVQIVVPDPTMATAVFDFNLAKPPSSGVTPKLSPIQLSLLLAWVCMIAATGAVAMLLLGVVTLSERRGAFVSAVTHELRTPLTTFRMYAEMLAEGMVPNAEKRQRYMETLRVEADRLAHLVENVLSYARLERGRQGKQRERVSIDRLIDKIEPRIIDRTTQSEMKLTIEAVDEVLAMSLTTDPAAVEQILFNLVDNACKYATTEQDQSIQLRVERVGKTIRMAVRDHGPGISPQEAKSLFQPFSKSVQQAANSAPGVGLGLALCRRLARALGGRLDLESPPDGGAEFVLTLPIDAN